MHLEPFVGFFGRKGWAGQGSWSAPLPQEISPSSPVDLLTLCDTHTEAGDVRDLWCFLVFVLIKSNPSDEEINLELLGWEIQDAGGLC